MSKLILLCLIFGALLIRAIISLYSYSGYMKPPLFGDFEAQRHWQEITVNLPISDWYSNTTNNDLLYWGLDYPPLTAYHSWIMGVIAKNINSSYISLHSSHGITNDEHKTFMRATVLLSDLLLYIPSLIFAASTISKSSKTSQILCYTVPLLYPGQIIIDNGHFQYNNISLGLAALAIASIFNNSNHIAAVFFVLALNYKQMELYHALPFFCYLLAHCFSNPLSKSENWIRKLISSFIRIAILGLIVIVSFALLWLPWLRSIDHFKQVVHRIFPVARGIFEDKVSNVWCVVNVFYKLK